MSEAKKEVQPKQTKENVKRATPAKELAEAKRNANKRIWSIEACKKSARRFDNEDGWKQGAPSSYKAACSHGWREECLKVMHNKHKQSYQKKYVAA